MRFSDLIFCDRLLKVVNALVQSLLGSLIPPVAALQIEPIGFRIRGVGFGHALLRSDLLRSPAESSQCPCSIPPRFSYSTSSGLADRADRLRDSRCRFWPCASQI